jgi:hypothetical protein
MPPDLPAPDVVIIGGYLTEPIFYQPLRSRLLARGAGSVTVTRLHWPDWMAMSLAGMGPVMLRGARTIRETRRRSSAPVLVVAHSAGGLVARLAMSPEPLDGRQVGVSDDVGCLVTLGTPHRLLPAIPFWRHPGIRATEFLDEVTPGAYFAPTTAYLTVGSTLVDPGSRAPTNSLKHAINRVMRQFVGEEPNVRGDGIVGNAISQLDGASHVELPDVLHGTFGGPWYGDGHVVDRWWPAALDQWRSALEARQDQAA